MIDFHAHILPNIDDGSQSIEETFKLIKEAKEAGFSTIISTAHYIEGHYEKSVSERKVWIEGINEKLKEKNENIQIKIGNEIYITENIIKLLEEGKATTIEESSYLLFEMPLNIKPMNLYDFIFDILQYKLIPILAHPERYSFIQKKPNIIYDLMQKGVLMQVNYGSFIGIYGYAAKIIAEELLRNDMIHFLGTDVHRQNTIYPQIPEIIERIEEIVGKEKVEELTTINPKLAINNKKIEIAEPKEIKLTLKEKMKLKMSK